MGGCETDPTGGFTTLVAVDAVSITDGTETKDLGRVGFESAEGFFSGQVEQS